MTSVLFGLTSLGRNGWSLGKDEVNKELLLFKSPNPDEDDGFCALTALCFARSGERHHQNSVGHARRRIGIGYYRQVIFTTSNDGHWWWPWTWFVRPLIHMFFWLGRWWHLLFHKPLAISETTADAQASASFYSLRGKSFSGILFSLIVCSIFSVVSGITG